MKVKKVKQFMLDENSFVQCSDKDLKISSFAYTTGKLISSFCENRIKNYIIKKNILHTPTIYTA